jgi:hypothetical protein
MANRCHGIDAVGHTTEEAGRLKVDIGTRDEDLYGGQS